ncbi:MAG: PaREP1/PaREP8 domain-containing protein [Candidatus Brockarchaeota archaeon]|nr:PaREP1/PaREP8 domain-containing protein [Candidatus Brockarchaeota archaeon]
MSKQDYLRLNAKYLREAEELIKKKDYPQASEKIWGALVEAMKAVASERGISLGTYRSIAVFVSELDKEYPELRLREVFRHAESLHVNFYEDHLPEDYVIESKHVISRVIEQLLAR